MAFGIYFCEDPPVRPGPETWCLHGKSKAGAQPQPDARIDAYGLEPLLRLLYEAGLTVTSLEA